MAPHTVVNWAIYNSLPPGEAQYQLAHVNDSKRVQSAIAYTICLSVTFLAVVMRFLSRRIGRTEYGADDWVMVLGLVLTVADSTSALLATFAYGGAQHAILMADNDPVRFAKSVFAAEIGYAPTIGVIKIGTLLLFARIFPGLKFKRILWAVGLFISTYSAVMVITVIFQCRPINRIWNASVKAECIDISKLWTVMASLNVLTDFLVLCLPLRKLWRLQMRRGTKLQLIGIFSIGSFATVISIYRIPQLHGLSLNSYDPTWTDVEPSLWSIVEVSAATLGACSITYRPLFNWVFRIQSSTSGSEGKPPLAGAARSLTANPLIGSDPNIGIGIKMQARNAFHPPVPASAHGHRRSGTGDGFYRIEESTEV